VVSSVEISIVTRKAYSSIRFSGKRQEAGDSYRRQGPPPFSGPDGVPPPCVTSLSAEPQWANTSQAGKPKRAVRWQSGSLSLRSPSASRHYRPNGRGEGMRRTGRVDRDARAGGQIVQQMFGVGERVETAVRFVGGAFHVGLVHA
jgi:hypothetical protein